MIIKSVLTTEVIFHYDGDLNDVKLQDIIDNECQYKKMYFIK